MHITAASTGSDLSVDGPGAFLIAMGVVIFLIYTFAAAGERKRDLDKLSGKTNRKEKP
jgi:hypothetical protein